MKINRTQVAASAIAIVELGDVAVGSFAPTWDFGNLPVREYAGAFGGVYAAHLLVGGSKDLARVGVEALAGRFLSDFADMFLPPSLDVAGLPVRRYLGAAGGIIAAQASGVEAAVAKAV